MSLLDTFTILVCTLMTGVEAAVSLFVNPAIWKLDDRAQAAELAHVLGRVMPFWYATGLILLALQAFLHRHTSAVPLLLSAAVLWLFIIVGTILLLVPLNNRVAEGTLEWRTPHHRWDTLHRWRVALLIAALICLLLGLHV